MAVIDLGAPSRRELRWFGLLLLLVFGALAVVAGWQARSAEVPRVLLGIGLFLALLYYLVPALREPLYFVWTRAVYPIGWSISSLLLATVYYLVITPLGILFRMLGRDQLQRRFDPATESYWEEHDPGGDVSRYLRQS